MSNLYKNILTRQSCRKYSLEKLSDQLIRDIKKELVNIETIFDTDLSILLVTKYDIYSMLEGYIGNIGKIDAPYYLILSNENTEKGHLDVGYGGEQALLYLNSLGLGTCWIGTNFSDDQIKKHFNISKDVLALISFGMPSESLEREPTEAKRKDINEILIYKEIKEEFSPIIEAIRLAPSAVNNQPWRVLVKENRISLFLAKPNIVKRLMIKDLNYIDMGIAIKHLEISLRNFGYTFSYDKNSNESFKDLAHIISANIKE